MVNFTDFDITIDKITWLSEQNNIREWKYNAMAHPSTYRPNYYSLRFVTEGSQKTIRGKDPMYIQGKGAFILHTSERLPYKSFSNELPYRYSQIYFYTTSPFPEEIFTHGLCELMPKETERISLLFLKAHEVYLSKAPLWKLEMKAILNELLVIFFKAYNYKDIKRSIPSLARNAADIITKNVTDKNLSVSEIAKSLYVSPEHLIRTFRDAYGETPKQYITNLRLQRASELLKSTQSPIAEIAETSGFSSVFHFNKTFKTHFDMTPSQFRKQKNPEFLF